MNSHPTLRAKLLWQKIDPEQWPIAINDLPMGTALVGGAIRDGLLGRLKSKPDLDLVVPSKALELAKALAEKYGAKNIVLDARRNIARLALDGWTIDLANLEGTNISADLWRRDFRVNAIGLILSPNPQLLDPTGGIQNLKNKALVAVSEANLIADPIRLLRGLRIMAEMELELDPQTKRWINSHKRLIQNAAPERIQNELQRLVNAQGADEAIHLLKRNQILQPWESSVNELSHQPPSIKNAKELTSEEINIALPLARLTHLLSDKGLESLRFSRRQRQRCFVLRKWKNKNDGRNFASLDEKERLKLHQDLEKDLPALIIDFSINEQIKWLKRWRNSQDPLFHPSSPIDGNTIQELLNLPAGKKIGELMTHLCHEKAFGRLQTPEEALTEARCWNKRKNPYCD